MTIIEYPKLEDLGKLLARPTADFERFRRDVAPILAAVQTDGDAAVRFFSKKFDGFSTENPAVSAAEFDEAEKNIFPNLKAAIRQAYSNIRLFHERQREPEIVVETMPGVICRRRSVAIERVGLYVPGGSAPLFSTALMLGIPAQIAGCQEVVLCTPPDATGKIHPAILFAARLCGIEKVFKIGGAQAIAAMAFGTETVPKVWKIFGPGNPWVTAAKQLVSLDGTAIDLPAGPSEVAIIADDSANPIFVAADLLSQAEHGADSQVVLFSPDKNLILNVLGEIKNQLADLPRREIAEKSLAESRAVLVKNLDEAVHFSNFYAPEHLILQTCEPEKLAAKITNAGSVFLGHFTPESAGDYASGTNHTLPTAGFARAFAGVSLDSFLKKITFQEISAAGLDLLAPTVVEMARAEGLEAHARAILWRSKFISTQLLKSK